MRRLCTDCIAAATLAAVLVPAAGAAAQLSYTTVALRGQPAPGTSAGVEYGDFSATVVNDVGHVASYHFLGGEGATSDNDTAIYAGPAAFPVLVAQAGNAAPGTPPGTVYDRLHVDTPTLNDAGQIAYVTSLTGSGVTDANDDVIYAGSFASPTLVAREGDQAPGAPTGVTYGSLTLFAPPSLSDNGQVAYVVNLAGEGVTGANEGAIYAGPIGAPQLIVREGEPALGMPAGVNYSDVYFTAPQINDAGHVAYQVNLTGSDVTIGNNNAIYAGPVSSPAVVARSGDSAPGTSAGVDYFNFSGPTLNDAGQVAYNARLTGSGVTSENNSALYAGSPDSPQLVARTGDVAPGMPLSVRYASLGAFPGLNDAGEVAYLARFTASEVTEANDEAIYAGSPESPTLILRTGDQAAGAASGVAYSDIAGPTLNDAGQLVFLSSLTGGGVTDANDFGLFAFDPEYGQVLIAREGDAFDVGGGDLRTIAGGGVALGDDSIEVTSGRNDDRPGGLGNDGTVAFKLRFTDGSRGIFTAVIPEPAGLALLAAGGLALLRRSRP